MGIGGSENKLFHVRVGCHTQHDMASYPNGQQSRIVLLNIGVHNYFELLSSELVYGNKILLIQWAKYLCIALN
jgi:hypothetical protein